MPAARRRIFDDFFTTRTHGAGIGLAVVRRIVDDHAPDGRQADRGASLPGVGRASGSHSAGTSSGLRRSLRPPPNTGNPAE